MNAEALPAVGPVWWAWMVRPAITGLLLVGLAAILERTALSRTPAGRSWMWRIVFLHLALLLVFPVPFAVGGWLVGEIRVERAVPRGTPVDAMTDRPGSDPRERSTEAGLSSPVGMSESGGTVLPLLAAAAWCAGVFRGAIRLLRTHRTARRWVRDSGRFRPAWPWPGRWESGPGSDGESLSGSSGIRRWQARWWSGFSGR